MTLVAHKDVVRRLATTVLAFSAVLLCLAAVPAASHAAACTPPVVNQIACENSKPGADPSTWEIEKEGDDSIQGYATQMSVNHGQTINFKIKSDTANYTIDILRLGYYGGDGARLIASNVPHTGTGAQPDCLTDSTTGLIDCGNWTVSASWAVPADAVSGVYIAHLKRTDTGGDSHITFVVRDDSRKADIGVMTSDETWQAYNTYGGNSLYQCTVACPPGNPAAYKAAYKVSYNRPFHTAGDDGGRSWIFSGAEFPMIRFLERNGYDLSYISGVDANSRPALLSNFKTLLSSGHDEYWSAQQRANVEAARDSATNPLNLAFFTGNEVFWKTRFEPSTADGGSTADRTLVSYKDTHFTTPQDPVSWTGTWRDPRFTTDADNVKPENALTGQSFVVNSGTTAITVPYAFGKLRMWKNTAAATLLPGGTLTLAPKTLGYEWDVDPDNGFRPKGEIHLSSTTVTGLEVFKDYGNTTTLNGTATHTMSLYKAASGALVFGSGTVQWAWGLDDDNTAGNTADPNMQQATINLFADLGAKPSTLMTGMVAATASTDKTAPTATVNTLPATVADGARVTVSGTAADTGGGIVAGVEVSTDGGTSWHPATSGTTAWTYTWIAHGSPSATIMARASDDSANVGNPSASKTVAVTCPCSLWGNNVTPPVADMDSNDPTPVEVGVKFKADAYGTISGLRFYKAATNLGTHIGTLWSSTGQQLARATFTNETATGWQKVTFDQPVEVQANTTYVATYYAPQGHYSATSAYFFRNPAPGPNGGAVVDSPPLHAVRNTAGVTNGVFAYSSAPTFPQNSFNAGNYWVDVAYTKTPAPDVISTVTAASAGLTSATVTWSLPAGGTATTYKITPYVNGVAQTALVKTLTGSNLPLTTRVTGLTNGTTYTFSVQASNPNGTGPESVKSNAVTPLVPVAPTAPNGPRVQMASQMAKVDWDVPDSDGDAAIQSYTVTPYSNGVALATKTVQAPATTTTITGLTNGTGYSFKVSATNSAGTGPQSAATPTVAPQETLFDFSTPSVVDAGDTHSVELGVKFTARYDGAVTGIRFYKSAANTGTHIGSLWSADGTRLATGTFANESATGWQTMYFSVPVIVTAGTTYVASYFAPTGHYSADANAFNSAFDNDPLTAVATTTSANGVFGYGNSSLFPTSTFKATNYWVDVDYASPPPGKVTSVVAAEGGRTSANLTWTAPAFSGTVQSYVITPYIGDTAQSTTTVDGKQTTASITGLTNGTTYTFTVQALYANGAGAVSDRSNAVTPLVPVAPSQPTGVTAEPSSAAALVDWSVPASDGDSPLTGYTVTPYINGTAQTAKNVDASTTETVLSGLKNGTTYTFKITAKNAAGTSVPSAASDPIAPDMTLMDLSTPASADSGDTKAVEVGTKFQTDFPGRITGIRFYKGATNIGTHIGSLWTTDGVRVATATFSNETATGWQSVTFPSPVDVTPGTTYVASYYAPKGHYSVSSGGFLTQLSNPPLRALATSVSANGVFTYGTTSTYPSGTFGGSNYFVDVLFDPAAAPGQPTGVSATAGPRAATVTWTAPSTGAFATSYTITPYIGSQAQPSTTVTGSPAATTATIEGLTTGTAYTFTVQATNPGGTGPASDPSNAVTPLPPAPPGAPRNVSADPNTKSATVSWDPPASGGGAPLATYTVTPYVGSTPGTPVTVDVSATKALVTGLTNGTSYTFTVKATSSAGTGPESAPSSAVAPSFALLDLGTPAVLDAADKKSTVVGVKFTSDVAGTVTGVRFYKAALNTGTHIGTLYSAAGDVLAQATFANETDTGWQTVKFATPVAVTAGTTYVASYLAPKGHYSVTSAAFTAGPLDNPPLHALANSSSPNGVFAYSATPVFPTSTFNATNYWVDILFTPNPS